MPLYEYECRKCHRRFERIQKFSDPPADKCPECGGKVDQVISAPAVQFKGSGWYVTDYAGKNPKGKSDSKPEGKPDAKSDSGGDKSSKSESKSDKK